MPRRITIQPHLTIEELGQRHRNATDPVERSHYQIIWLLAQGQLTEDVAKVTGYSRSWIYELIWGYNRIGPQTLGDKRHDHPGAAPLLTPEQVELLRVALKTEHPSGKKWNGALASEWMSEILGRSVSRQRGWEYLKLLKRKVPRTPKPRKPKARSRDDEPRIRRARTAIAG
jgi:transposase